MFVDIGNLLHRNILEIAIFRHNHADDGVFQPRHETHVGEDIEAAESVPLAVFGRSVERQVHFTGVEPGIKQLEDLDLVGFQVDFACETLLEGAVQGGLEVVGVVAEQASVDSEGLFLGPDGD